MSSNRRDARYCISRKRRTSCCVTGLRNLGPLARVSLAQQTGGTNGACGGEERKEAEEKDAGGDDTMDYMGVGVDGMDVAGGGEILDCAAAAMADAKCHGGEDGGNGGDGGDGWASRDCYCSDGDNNFDGDNGDGDGDDDDVDDDSDSDGSVYEPALPNRPPRKFLPSQRQAIALLSMAVPPEDRGGFGNAFVPWRWDATKNRLTRGAELCAGHPFRGSPVPMTAITFPNCVIWRTCSGRQVIRRLS
jgi:hypothetical protein